MDHDKPRPLGAHLLRRWRDLAGLTQAQVAERIGSDFVQVSKFERGVCRPGRTNANRIAEVSEGLVPAESWDKPGPVDPAAGDSPEAG